MSRSKTAQPSRPTSRRSHNGATLWATAAAGFVLVAAFAATTLTRGADPVGESAATDTSQDMIAFPALQADAATGSALGEAGPTGSPLRTTAVQELRLQLDETVSYSPVSAAVNAADARLKSLIIRHDRLAEMVADLSDNGIKVALTVADFVPQWTVSAQSGKPRLLDAEDGNARHPLYAFVRDVRGELSRALQESADSALARTKLADARLDSLAIRQFGVLDRIEKEVERRRDKLAAVPRALGIDLPGRGDNEGLGGPLVPLSGTEAVIYAFETRMEAVELTLANLSDIGRIVTRLPVRRPVSEDASISSGYGPRMDPFLGRPAMHQGLDFRASKGTQVMAAGAGKVVRAGRLGGYGNVVEIDHGQGITSRYAHLSRISVKVGDTVKPGDAIGKVGSTGRSTGPHLHFEVRRNGASRNPITYIRAGQRLS